MPLGIIILKFSVPRTVVLGTLAGLFALMWVAASANASLLLLKPSPADPATFVGNGGYSADGLGQNGTGGSVQADVPAGSTVVQAYLYASYFGTISPIPLLVRTVDFDGTTVVLDELTNSTTGNLRSARADVTGQVAAKVGGGGGITNFAVNTDPTGMDGVALVVIFSNPALPFTTIAVLDGGADQTGDTTTFNFAQPLDKTVTGFSAIMSLGIGFGFQGGGLVHECRGVQNSQVDINGSRLTSCAGSYDDGLGNNGALITVGGVGDSINNPVDPFATITGFDDELYNLEPFLFQGDTQLVINTINPSGDDIVFLAVIAVTAEAVVTTEICDDGIDNDGDGLIDGDDPDCQEPPLPSAEGFMTGGGNVAFGSGRNAERFSWGFNVQCDGSEGNFQFNDHAQKGKFHLEFITSVICSDDPNIEPGKPDAPFDTLQMSGEGRWNGESGAMVVVTVTDSGEPGSGDTIDISIIDASSVGVSSLSMSLFGGNHQAHSNDD